MKPLPTTKDLHTLLSTEINLSLTQIIAALALVCVAAYVGIISINYVTDSPEKRKAVYERERERCRGNVYIGPIALLGLPGRHGYKRTRRFSIRH